MPKPPREDHEGVGALEHGVFAHVHVLHHVQFGRALKGGLNTGQVFGNEADNAASPSHHGLRSHTHDAHMAAAVNQLNVPACHFGAQAVGCLGISGIVAHVGATEEAKRCQSAHGGFLASVLVALFTVYGGEKGVVGRPPLSLFMGADVCPRQRGHGLRPKKGQAPERAVLV